MVDCRNWLLSLSSSVLEVLQVHFIFPLSRYSKAGSKEEEWETTGSTYRFHHIKCLPVLHLMDLVHILHRRLIEVHSLFVQEFISLKWEEKTNSDFKWQPFVTLIFTVRLMSTCCASPLEVDSLSSWQRDSGACPPGNNIFHRLSQTSFSFPAGHTC